MEKYLSYFWYIVKHKYYVGIECFKKGLYWRGLVHDLSKLNPKCFIPCSKYLKGDIKKGRNESGYYDPTKSGNIDFELAVMRHLQKSEHHWQHWIIACDGGERVYEMSEKARLEMLCDWFGANKATNCKNTVSNFWLKNKHRMRFHSKTEQWIDENLR